MAAVDEIDETYGTDENYETDQTDESNDYEYSQEEAITAIREYYQFLCTITTRGGWKFIPDGWTDFDKTEEVLELLRHLPYLNFKVMGAPDCRFMSWHTGHANRKGEHLKIFTEPLPEEAVIPPHIMGLTYIERYTPVLLLDTQLGVVYWHDPPGEIMFGTNGLFGEAGGWVEDGLIPEDQLEWRENSGIWLIKHFFGMLKEKFKTLEFVPFGRHKVEAMWPFIHRREVKQKLLEAIREMYRDHGWPDMTCFRKENCLADIDAMVKTRFPDMEDEYNSVD